MTDVLAASISEAVWLGESRQRLTVINAHKQVVLDTVFKKSLAEKSTTEEIQAKPHQKRVKFEQTENKQDKENTDSNRVKLGKRTLGFDSSFEDDTKSVVSKKKRKRQRLEQAVVPTLDEVINHWKNLMNRTDTKPRILATKETIDIIGEPDFATAYVER